MLKRGHTEDHLTAKQKKKNADEEEKKENEADEEPKSILQP